MENFWSLFLYLCVRSGKALLTLVFECFVAKVIYEMLIFMFGKEIGILFTAVVLLNFSFWSVKSVLEKMFKDRGE